MFTYGKDIPLDGVVREEAEAPADQAYAAVPANEFPFTYGADIFPAEDAE